MTKTKKPKKEIPLEKVVQRSICDYLQAKGYFFWRSNNIPVFGRNNAGMKTFRSMPKHTPKGLPDIIMIHRGEFIGLEVKREGAKLRPDQQKIGCQIVDNGGYYYVVHNLVELVKYLDRHGEEELGRKYKTKNSTKQQICKGCGELFDPTMCALSRYAHGNICGGCGTTEALTGDFIQRALDLEK